MRRKLEDRLLRAIAVDVDACTEVSTQGNRIEVSGTVLLSRREAVAWLDLLASFPWADELADQLAEALLGPDVNRPSPTDSGCYCRRRRSGGRPYTQP